MINITKIHNHALHWIGVQLPREFEFSHVFGIQTLCSNARPPRELVR